MDIKQVISGLYLKKKKKDTAKPHNSNHNNHTWTQLCMFRELHSTLQQRLSSTINLFSTMNCILQVQKLN